MTVRKNPLASVAGNQQAAGLKENVEGVPY